MNALRLALAGLLVLGLTALAGAQDTKDEKKTEKKAEGTIDKDKLVGTWEATKGGPPKGTGSLMVHFTKDGKVSMTVRFKPKGKDKETELSQKGTYKLDGNKLTLTRKAKDKEETRTMTITKLTDTDLITKDDKDRVTEFKKRKARAE